MNDRSTRRDDGTGEEDRQATDSVDLTRDAAADELQTVRSGPELDEARTAPIALPGAQRPDEVAAPAVPPMGAVLRNLHRSGAVRQAATLLALVGFVAGAVADLPRVAAVVCLVAVLLPLAARGPLRLLRRGLGPLGTATTSRTLLAASLALLLPGRPEAVVVAALLGAAVLLEPVLQKVNAAAVPYAVNLPGVAVRNGARVDARRVFVLTTLLLLLGVGGAALGLPTVLALLMAVVALIAAAAALLDAALRVRARRRTDAGPLAEAVTAYAPRFALHWDAPPGTGYQVRMWLPYLERIGERFVVIVRNARSFAEVAAATDAPVLVRQDPRALDAVVPASLRAVFYVNNAARNTHLIRYTGLTHVQLNHGESDKAPSYSPVFRLYDKDFVAGQAAIDRFAANGVHMPAELFTVVGRPQIEDVLVGTSTSAVTTALYAPTWGGANADSDYCSLPIGVRIVEGLLARGCTVVFRPHPYTNRRPDHAREAARIVELLAADARSTGRLHRFGPEATDAMSLIDCFNAADLLVSDVSSVVPDFLYSEKPFAVTSMQGTVSEFARSFPIARAAYVIDRSGRHVDQVLTSMTTTDPVAKARAEAKRYFLGDFPAEGYADVFLREARGVVLGG